MNYCIKSIVNKISFTNCGLLEVCGLLLVKNLHSLDISKLLRIFKIITKCNTSIHKAMHRVIDNIKNIQGFALVLVEKVCELNIPKMLPALFDVVADVVVDTLC